MSATERGTKELWLARPLRQEDRASLSSFVTLGADIRAVMHPVGQVAMR